MWAAMIRVVVASALVIAASTPAWADPSQKKAKAARILHLVEEFSGHVIILKYGVDFHEYRRVMKAVQKIHEVKATAPMVVLEATLVRGRKRHAVVVTGVSPGAGGVARTLRGHLKRGGTKKPLTSLLGHGRAKGRRPGIVLGRLAARTLGVKTGGTLTLEPNLGGKTRPVKVVVAAVLRKLGMEHHDQKMAWMGLEATQAMLGQGDNVTAVEVRCAAVTVSPRVAVRINKTLGTPYRALDFYTLHQALLRSLGVKPPVAAKQKP